MCGRSIDRAGDSTQVKRFFLFSWAICQCVAAAAHPDAAPAPPLSAEAPVLRFDLPGVKVGVAEYEEGPTGTTVLYFPTPVLAAIDVRGGAPGTVNSDALRLPHDGAFVDAIAIAGGSAYGLSALTGVANALKESTADPGNWKNVAVVAGAIIFDLGDRRYNAVTPDDALGRAALRNAIPGLIPLGARGAGRFAMQGRFFGRGVHSGQGAAIRQAGSVKVLVVTVVNAYGAVVDRQGQVRGCEQQQGQDCGAIADRLSNHLEGLAPARLGANAGDGQAGLTGNTTITVVVTNQALPFATLHRLAIQTHNSMARAIQPFGTAVDGDTLFAVTTAEVSSGTLDPTDLGALASEAAWDAILASVPPVESLPPREHVVATAKDLTAALGRYSLAPDVIAQIRRKDAGLEIEVTGRGSLYLAAGKAIAMTAVGRDQFALVTSRADRLQIDRDPRGRVVGFTINPGSWPIRARRAPS